MADSSLRDEPFPAQSEQAVGEVNGVRTEVSRTAFSDKILVTVSQEGRLAQWVSLTVPLVPGPGFHVCAISGPGPALGPIPGRSRHGLAWGSLGDLAVCAFNAAGNVKSRQKAEMKSNFFIIIIYVIDRCCL